MAFNTFHQTPGLNSTTAPKIPFWPSQHHPSHFIIHQCPAQKNYQTDI